MPHDRSKLFELLPDDITDEAAFMLSRFIEDLQILIDTYFYPNIKRYLSGLDHSESQRESISEDEDREIEDPPF